MKKIGIVTMIGNDNYGNLLQNYAVKKLIEDIGYDAITLNNNIIEDKYACSKKIEMLGKFEPKYMKRYFKAKLNQLIGCKNSYDYNFPRLFKLLQNRKYFYQCKIKRMENFKSFRKMYIPYEVLPVYDKNFPVNSYEAFVCGSDVIWHPTYHYNKSNDFLCFAPKYKRIALAPSFGVNEIPEDRIIDYKIWLSEIKYLSIREKAGATIIRNLIQKEVEVLPDPTLTISAKHWREMSKPPKLVPKKQYILCYFLGNVTKEYHRWIEKCRKAEEKEIVYIYDANFLEYYASDPCEFLWLIDNAEAVFTDSFHGIVFSMLFHTPFVAFRRVEEGLNIFSRIESLLSITNMENREFGKVDYKEFDKLDFKLIDQKILDMRNKELNFLSDALSEINRRSSNNG